MSHCFLLSRFCLGKLGSDLAKLGQSSPKLVYCTANESLKFDPLRILTMTDKKLLRQVKNWHLSVAMSFEGNVFA